MSDDLEAIQAAAAEAGADVPGPTGESAPRRDYRQYQPERFRGNPVAKGIDWAADAALGRFVGLPKEQRPGTGDFGAAWAAFLFYVAGAPPGMSGPLHPGINAAVHTGKYGYKAYDAMQEAQAGIRAEAEEAEDHDWDEV